MGPNLCSGVEEEEKDKQERLGQLSEVSVAMAAEPQVGRANVDTTHCSSTSDHY